MKGLKIAVIGAGSTYTPELIQGFIKRKDELPVESFCLMDIDKVKLEVVGGLAKRMLDANDMDCSFIMTNKLETALMDADFVVAQIRVGKLDAREKDEKIPLKYGLIGQETTGIGGFMKAMRTIPVLMDIASKMNEYCPDAWLINFSNPSGLMAEVLQNHTGIKMMGLCNAPYSMNKQVMEWVPKGCGEVIVDYVGLNHLSWISALFCDGKDILQEKLFEEDTASRLKNLANSKWEVELLRTVKAFPVGYLDYYYHREGRLKHLLEEEKSRAEVCRDIERDLLQMYGDPGLREKPALLDQRGGAYYSEAAVSLISAIYNDKNEIHVVNTKNNGALDFMDSDDVVEIGCRITGNGAEPLPPKGPVNGHIKAMMKTVKYYEKHAALAGLNGDYEEALRALLIHPLVGDFNKAKGALDELMEAHKEYLPQFYRK